MANSVFISSCSRRELARRRPGRAGRRTAGRRGATIGRRSTPAAALRLLAVAVALALAVAAVVVFAGI